MREVVSGLERPSFDSVVLYNVFLRSFPKKEKARAPYQGSVNVSQNISLLSELEFFQIENHHRMNLELTKSPATLFDSVVCSRSVDSDS